MIRLTQVCGPKTFTLITMSALLLITIMAPTVLAAPKSVLSNTGQQQDTSSPGVPGKLAFASDAGGNYDIYVTNADGTGRLQLTTDTADDVDPTWSPDGSRLAFISNRDGNFEIYSMNADGSQQTRLTNTAGNEFDPAWSPNGSQIAFSSDRDGDFEIYTMNADGSRQVNITNSASDDAFPSWSPDSTRIAFDTDRSGNAEIYIVNADGSNPINLTNNAFNDEFPAWSPNGRLIAFASDRFGTFDIFLMNADGSSQRRITRGSEEESYPAWSPDGSRLAYMDGELVGSVLDRNDIVITTLDGSTQRNITGDAADEIFPDWQPLRGGSQFNNPIDDPGLFVRQQYLDFLNREPDQAGLAYWTGQITSCGNDARCIHNRRIDVSAAFFIEQEFQQTGFFVVKLYRGPYARRPTFAEFSADRNSLRAGSGLEAGKQALVQDFVQRPEFVGRYPVGLSGPDFVTALIKSVRDASGVDLSSRRDQLTAAFNSGGRALVVRNVIDDAAFTTAEFNRAFVLAEYFGYLRRDPDEAGFQFWLNTLNANNNPRGMVCAFITSAEYQLRFGPTVTRTNQDCATYGP